LYNSEQPVEGNDTTILSEGQNAGKQNLHANKKEQPGVQAALFYSIIFYRVD
jgi:hypothetical protein